MNLTEATQMQANGVGVLQGTDLDFEQPLEFPCDDCGEMVDLSRMITVSVVGPDGVTTEQQEMTEANARVLLAQVGLPPPPVLCSRHDDLEPISTETTKSELEALERLDALPDDCECGIEIATGRRLEVPICPVHGEKA